MAIFGHGVIPDRQNKVSSCRIVCILQPTTMHLPLDRSIDKELGNIVHDRQCRRNFVIVDKVGMDAGGTSN
jgi:hypothetical protein